MMNGRSITSQVTAAMAVNEPTCLSARRVGPSPRRSA